MEKLSLDAINAKSEYCVKKEDDEGTYSFTTDNMTEFFISFEKDDILRSGILHFFIYVRLVMACKRCAADYSNIGLVYITKKKNIYSYLKWCMMKKKMRIMPL